MEKTQDRDAHGLLELISFALINYEGNDLRKNIGNINFVLLLQIGNKLTVTHLRETLATFTNSFASK